MSPHFSSTKPLSREPSARKQRPDGAGQGPKDSERLKSQGAMRVSGTLLEELE